MSLLKRVWLSIIYRPIQSLLLFLFTLLLANVMAGSYTILQTTTTIKQEIKDQFGARVTVQYPAFQSSNNVSLFFF
ncbi:hypothetical protein [Amphibacillus sediminis]|uniref:hypothetical protein n=1 Tax=Amphibacillus sediminis TaxID=360185 RepID=UPI0008304A10|nr:hypothetical protein [Amphibacillus sediminis]